MSDTTTSEIGRRLVQVREEGGAIALGRVLTLIIAMDGDFDEAAVAAANRASGEHPMRVIALHRSDPGADRARIDAEIRVGAHAGAGEVVVLHVSGPAGEDPDTLVQALLLPDAPIVCWWPRSVPEAPGRTPLGRLAQSRIVDTGCAPRPDEVLERLRGSFTPGDGDLAWTRITLWRAQLAAVLDQAPYEPVRAVEVHGRPGSSSALLMAAWLRLLLDAPTRLLIGDEALPCGNSGLGSVRLERGSGAVRLARTSDAVLSLHLPDHAPQPIPMPVRDLTDLLSEELRSLAPDRVLQEVLERGVPLLSAPGRASS